MPLNIFDGSSWNPLKKIQIHDGSSWNESKAAYVWDGSEWKPLLDLRPKNITLPTLSLQGNAIYYGAQETVQVSTGTWTSSPTTFEYQWQKSVSSGSGYSWSNIVGKTSNTLFLNEDEWDSAQLLKYVGYAVRCKVIAKNATGENIDPVYTLPSPVINPAALPEISVNVVSNGIVEFTWLKSIAATDYYVQYQGPRVDFTEITSLVNNTDATKGVYSTEGNTRKFRIDTGSASGSLGILINPKNVSNPSGQTLTGYGKNAIVYDLKPNKPSVSASMQSFSWGGTISWTNTLINQTGWAIYNNGELYSSSYLSGTPSQTYFDIDRLGEGGTSFGSFTVTVTGTVPRFTETSWSSSPSLSITYPTNPLPVNQISPTVSTSNGRSFSATTGTWSNSSSIYSYLYEWFADGVAIDDFAIYEADTINLYDTTAYDNKTITCSVYALTTDLRFTAKAPSSNSAQSLAQTSTPPAGGGESGGSTPPSFSPEWRCTESYPGAGVGNCQYTKPGYDNTGSGSGYSRVCLFQLTDPDCQSTAAATQVTYYAGTATADFQNDTCVSQPSVTGPFTAASIPTDTSVSGGRTVTWTMYRSTSAAALAAATTGACAPATPPASTPPASTPPTTNCSTCLSSGNEACGNGGTRTYCITPGGCDNIYGPCTGETSTPPATPPTSLPSCPGTITNAASYTCAELGRVYYGGPSDYNIGTGRQCCGGLISTPPATPPSTPPATPDCSSCTGGSGTQACGNGGTQTYCITPSGCANIYGACTGETAVNCNNCNSYGGACGQYGNGTLCITPGGCPNLCIGDGPSTPPATPPASTPPSSSTPPVEVFSPPSFKGKCLAPNALLMTENGLVMAKDITIGAKLITIGNAQIDIVSVSENKTSGMLSNNVELTESSVASVTEKISKLIGFNNMGKNYSITQPIFIKSEGGIEYKNAGDIKIGNILLSVNSEGQISEIAVDSIQVDDFDSTVYDIRTSPEPWFIVNGLIAIA